MQTDSLKILNWILKRCISSNADEAPDGLFSLLMREISAVDLNDKAALEIIAEIKKAVKLNPAFQDAEFVNYISGLPLSYILGLK